MVSKPFCGVMRAILHADVVTLARCLLAVDVDERAQFCGMVFEMAHAGDKYRKRFGRWHHKFGSGTLASACWGLPRKLEPFLSDKDYADCMRIIFDRIAGKNLS
jgi:hypothetical protein